MPFDPAKPADGSPLVSAEMRAQLVALKALIDAVPAGPPGPTGEVSNAQLSFAIGGTARDPVDISPSGFQVSDPPTQSEVQAIGAFVLALANALKRSV